VSALEKYEIKKKRSRLAYTFENILSKKALK